MSRVYGTLFEDGRSGVLVVKASRPFFGSDRHERQYPVIDGQIDIQLAPNPPGTYYNVGFKEQGDIRRTDFTLQWRIPRGEFDITPDKEAPQQASTRPNTIDRVQARRLATELADALELVNKLEQDLESSKRREQDLRAELQKHKAASQEALSLRDEQIAQLSLSKPNKVRTVVKEVPVPPERLEKRIKTLETENQFLRSLNDTYYESVLELHQLKLDRAQTVYLHNPVTEIPGTPQQRLINKLLAK